MQKKFRIPEMFHCIYRRHVKQRSKQLIPHPRAATHPPVIHFLNLAQIFKPSIPPSTTTFAPIPKKDSAKRAGERRNELQITKNIVHLHDYTSAHSFGRFKFPAQSNTTCKGYNNPGKLGERVCPSLKKRWIFVALCANTRDPIP